MTYIFLIYHVLSNTVNYKLYYFFTFNEEAQLQYLLLINLSPTLSKDIAFAIKIIWTEFHSIFLNNMAIKIVCYYYFYIAFAFISNIFVLFGSERISVFVLLYSKFLIVLFENEEYSYPFIKKTTHFLYRRNKS